MLWYTLTMRTSVNIRTNIEERRRWKKQANLKGMDFSQYVRWLILKDEKNCLYKRKDI